MIHARFILKKASPAIYGMIMGTDTVTPLEGCTLMLTRLLRVLLRKVTVPISGS
jgi:hypothetical protein